MTNQDTDIAPEASISGRTASNQADELNRLMKVRRAALNRIGEHTIRTGAPMATIEEPLVPIYMYHRYAVEVGGVDGRRARTTSTRCAATAARRPNGSRRRISARRSTRWRRRCKPSELTVPKQVLDADSAASAGLRHASRAVPAHDRRRVRSAQPGDRRGRRDDRLHAAARSRGAHGGAARRRSDAARPRGSDRPADEGDLRRADRDAVRGGGPPRRGARAGRSRDVAGDGVAERRRCARSRRCKLAKLAARLRATAVGKTEADTAQRTLLAADIKRFLERPAEVDAADHRRGARRAAGRADRRHAGKDWLAAPPWFQP